MPCSGDGQTPWYLDTRHPKIVTRDFQPLGRYFCIEKINILNLRGLYLPVLPYEVALCHTCACTNNIRTSVSVNKATNRRPSLKHSIPLPYTKYTTEIHKNMEYRVRLVGIYECTNSFPTETLSLLNISIARELWFQKQHYERIVPSKLGINR